MSVSVTFQRSISLTDEDLAHLREKGPYANLSALASALRARLGNSIATRSLDPISAAQIARRLVDAGHLHLSSATLLESHDSQARLMAENMPDDIRRALMSPALVADEDAACDTLIAMLFDRTYGVLPRKTALNIVKRLKLGLSLRLSA
jgi:hypothetical protein